TAPVWKFLLVLPHFLAGCCIPGHEGPAIASGTHAVRAVDAHERRALEKGSARYAVVHAQVVGRCIEKMRARGVRRWRSGTDTSLEARADVFHRALGRARLFVRIDHRAAGLHID